MTWYWRIRIWLASRVRYWQTFGRQGFTMGAELRSYWLNEYEDEARDHLSYVGTPETIAKALETAYLRWRLNRMRRTRASFMADPWTPVVNHGEARLLARLEYLRLPDDGSWETCRAAYERTAKEHIVERIVEAYQKAKLADCQADIDALCPDADEPDDEFLTRRQRDLTAALRAERGGN